MPVRDWGLAYSQLAIFFEDRFAAWRLMRVPPSNSRGLSAFGISGEDEKKQQHFCHCFSPFYSAACVGSLLSVALFGCIFSMVRILAIIAFTRFDFQNLWLRAAAVFGAAYTSFLLSVLFICAVLLFRYHIGTFHLFRILWLASLLVWLLSFWCGKIFFVRWNYYIIMNFQKSQLSFVAETSPKCAKRCETFSNVTWNAEYLIFVNGLDLKFACLNIL